MRQREQIQRIPDFSGRRVTVVGLGIEGQDLVRFFAECGAEVTVSEAKAAGQLEQQLQAVAGLDVRLSLGGNRADAVDSADLVAVSQGVPLDLPPIARAREQSIPITSRTKLFLELCPGPVIGISGSSGKTTTTSLVGAIVARSGRPSIVGGNIGGPLLTRLKEIDESTWVILEISHTQLVLTETSPQVAGLTNVTPNHLDRFTWDEYVALKRKLIEFQSAGDVAVLNYDNDVTRRMGAAAASRVLHFSLAEELPGDGAFLRNAHGNEQVILRQGDHEEPVLDTSEIPLRGRHNVENVLCATTLAGACGIPTPVISDAVQQFRPVPHRLELVATIDGVTYVNDSIATSPERTLAGMRSFQEPLVLLLGGRDKHLPVEELAEETVRRCRAVICFGEAGDIFARACRAAHPRGSCGPFIREVGTLDEAVKLATSVAACGDVVLLSPACTSYDAYDNFEERGAAFRALVGSYSAPRMGASNPAPPEVQA